MTNSVRERINTYTNSIAEKEKEAEEEEEEEGEKEQEEKRNHVNFLTAVKRRRAHVRQLECETKETTSLGKKRTRKSFS